MKATCPQCSAENLIDTSAESSQLGVLCTRCAMTYETGVVEDEAFPTFLPEHEDAATFAQEGSQLQAAPAISDDVLAMPEAAPEVDTGGDQALVLEDVFSQVNAPAAPTPGTQLAVTEIFDGDEVGEPPPSRAVADELTINPDNYAVGVRLLRIAPVWLLLGGISFITIITFCSWMRPAGQAEALTLNPVRQNQATNLATESAAASSVVSTQPGDIKPQVSTVGNVATKQMKVAEETKPAPAAPVVEVGTAGAGGGKYTLQVASYNDASQANEQVSILRAAGFETHVALVEIAKRGTWYRVQSGRFESREEAARYVTQMHAKGAAANAIIVEAGK